MAKTKIIYQDKALSIEEAAYFKMVVEGIIVAYELSFMALGSVLAKEATDIQCSQKAVDFILSSIEGIKAWVIGNIDGETDQLLQEFETQFRQFLLVVTQNADLSDPETFQKQLAEVQKENLALYKITDQYIAHIRQLRIERNIFEESHSDLEEIFYQDDDPHKIIDEHRKAGLI